MSESTDSANEQEEQTSNPTFRVPGRKVFDGGRVTIPDDLCEEHGIQEGDVLDLQVDAGDVTFWTLNLVSDKRGRVRIGKNARRIYGIEDGDYVTLHVVVTGISEYDDI